MERKRHRQVLTYIAWWRDTPTVETNTSTVKRIEMRVPIQLHDGHHSPTRALLDGRTQALIAPTPDNEAWNGAGIAEYTLYNAWRCDEPPMGEHTFLNRQIEIVAQRHDAGHYWPTRALLDG